MFVFPGKPEEEYRRQLGSFGVSGELALRPIDSLSGGQKSRVAFAILGMLRCAIRKYCRFLCRAWRTFDLRNTTIWAQNKHQ